VASFYILLNKIFMNHNSKFGAVIFVVCTLIDFSFTKPAQKQTAAAKENRVVKDPLPSWNEGTAKKSIIDFVNKTTKEGSADFVAVADRIACFDNDGTLWSEQPMYFQLAFAIDRIKAMAPQHPEWKTTQPFQALLAGDMKTKWQAVKNQ
jgi:hypothetical protein